MKADIIKSLRSRLDLLVDEADGNVEVSTESGEDGEESSSEAAHQKTSILSKIEYVDSASPPTFPLIYC